MKRKYQILIGALVIATALVAVLVNTVFASPRSSAGIPGQAVAQGVGCPHMGANYSGIVSDLLGLTPEEIQAQLQDGKSLVEIAAAKGVSEDQLVTAILAPMKEAMQGTGSWTQEQLDSHFQWMEQQVRYAINSTDLGQYGAGHCGFGQTGPNGQTPTPGGMMGGGGMMNGGGMMGNGGGMMGNGGGMMGGGWGGSGTGAYGPGGMMGGWGRTY